MAFGFHKPHYGKVGVPLWLVILLALPVLGRADANPVRPSRNLNQERIHFLYTEGDFDAVVAAVDSFTQSNETYSHGDSVFIAKHLAVVYTANPVTREKGKNYMFRLLSLLPSAKIVDMFVSDEIDRIFERVREEYEIKLRALGRQGANRPESDRYAARKMTVGATPRPQPAAKPKRMPAANVETPSSKVFLWVAGSAAVAAVGAFYLLQPGKPADKIYAIPE